MSTKKIEIIKPKKIKPLFNGVLVTAHLVTKMEENMHSVIEWGQQEGSVKEIQQVVSVGDVVKYVRPGDWVCLKYDRYARIDHRRGNYEQDENTIKDNAVVVLDIPEIELDGVKYFIVQDSDIRYKIEEYDKDVIEDTSDSVFTPKIIL